MEGVIRHRAGGSKTRVVLHDVAQPVASMLGCKRDDGGRSAERSGAGCRLERIRIHQPAAGELLDMAMSIHAAGENELAGGIDGAARLSPARVRRSFLPESPHPSSETPSVVATRPPLMTRSYSTNGSPKFQGASFIRFDARNLCRWIDLSKEKLTDDRHRISMGLSRPSRMERNPYQSTAPEVRQHVGGGRSAEATPGAGRSDRHHHDGGADKGVVSATQQADGEGT